MNNNDYHIIVYSKISVIIYKDYKNNECNVELLTNDVTRPSFTQNPIVYSFCNSKNTFQKFILHANHRIIEHITPVEKSTTKNVPILKTVLLMS